MSNNTSTGLQITPLTLWVAGGLSAALWGVLFAQGQRTQNTQEATKEAVVALVATKESDRRDIETLKGDVKSVQVDVKVLTERVGKLEPRK